MARVISVLAIMVLSALPLIGQGGGGQGGQAAPPMGFFITSTSMSGGNLGGLAGADKHCQTLAAASGMPGAAPGEQKPGWRLIGAVVEGRGGPWFFKAVGPKETMSAVEGEISAMFHSIEAGG